MNRSPVAADRVPHHIVQGLLHFLQLYGKYLYENVNNELRYTKFSAPWFLLLLEEIRSFS